MIKYSGQNEYDHRSGFKCGVLIANLGTPDAPTTTALRRYLREFLSDPRVIEIPQWKWWPILNLFVLTFRPRKSAALYKQVWTEAGSPLLRIGTEQRDALASALNSSRPEQFVVELGMRYGNPSIESALNKLFERGARKIFILPLYPQYAGATTGSTFDAVADTIKKWRWVPELRFATCYHDDPMYIQALVESIREVWDRDGKPEKLLLSFHGIPKRYFLGGDPYHCQCQKTGRLVAESLGLSRDEYLVSFQSLFGKEEWIRPYTNETLEAWGKSGLKRVDVICPGFSADCLETLEEIEEENKEVFLHAGGEQYRYIHALNSRPSHIALLHKIVDTQTADWSKATEEELIVCKHQYSRLVAGLAAK